MSNVTTKADLVETVSEKCSIPSGKGKEVVEAILEEISLVLARKGKVTLIGFGTFESRERSARQGRNPKTGEAISIPATTVPAFKAGKKLKELVNK